MKPLDLFRQAQALGLRLDLEQRLVVFGKSCPPEFAAVLREHKAALVEWLANPPCPGWQAVPPRDLPLDPATPEPTPEQRARLMDYLLRQGAGQPGALADWLARREAAYHPGPGTNWNPPLVAYAAARDAVCWQLKRDVEEACDLLAGFEEMTLSGLAGGPVISERSSGAVRHGAGG